MNCFLKWEISRPTSMFEAFCEHDLRSQTAQSERRKVEEDREHAEFSELLAVVFVVALEEITHNVLHVPDVHGWTKNAPYIQTLFFARRGLETI